MTHTRPILDEYADQSLSPQLEEELGRRGAERFLTTPEGVDYEDHYCSDGNSQLLQGWCYSRAIPITKRNLQVAFRELVADGILIPVNAVTLTPVPADKKAGIIKTTGAVTKLLGSEADRQLVAEKPERFQEILGPAYAEHETEFSEARSLTGIGKPVSPELRAAYKTSLRNEQPTTAMSKGEARAKVALQFPEMKVDSVAFNTAVTQIMCGN